MNNLSKNIVLSLFTILTLSIGVTSVSAQTAPYPSPPSQEKLDALRRAGDENLAKYGNSAAVTTTPTPIPTPSPTTSTDPSPETTLEETQQDNKVDEEKVSWWGTVKNKVTSFFSNVWLKISSIWVKDEVEVMVESDNFDIASPDPSETVQEQVEVVKDVEEAKPTSVAATPLPAEIIWSTRKLTWSDFAGTPNAEDVEKAKIAVRIAAQSSLTESCSQGGEVSCVVTISGFSISARMSTKQSYVLPGAETDVRLNHEQTHFNIAEVYARQLRSALNPYIGRSEIATGSSINEAFETAASRLDALVNPIVFQHQQELDREELLYDSETNHSLDSAAQKRWDEKIYSML